MPKFASGAAFPDFFHSSGLKSFISPDILHLFIGFHLFEYFTPFIAIYWTKCPIVHCGRGSFWIVDSGNAQDWVTKKRQ